MPRIARICAPNYPHHITQRGNNRGVVFFEDEDRKFYLEILCKYSHKWNLKIWAYCLMSNHVHILAVPGKPESLCKGIGGTNLIYTQYINRKYKQSGRLWQNRFFSTVIDKESYLWAAVRYIERNPVRAKLVAKAEDYQWSSAKGHVLGIKDTVLSDSDWLQERERETYREFLMHGDAEFEASIKMATSAGRVLETEKFVSIMEKILDREILPRKAGRPKKE